MSIKGIYCYTDTLNNDEIVYIGKDSQITRNNRHYNHITKKRNHYEKEPVDCCIDGDHCPGSRLKAQ